MAYIERIVCLAASTKFNHTCIAGKRVRSDGQIGEWVRPVSSADHGELTENEMAYAGGGRPALLDVIDIPMRKPRPVSCQVENHRIDDTQRWRRVGKFPTTRVDDLVDSPVRLWRNDWESGGGMKDRIPEDVASTLGSSLFLISPNQLRVHVSPGYEGRSRRVRARFRYNGDAYNIVVTDPVVIAQYRGELGEHPIAEGSVRLCISLGAVFEQDGCRYKLAAAFVPAR